MTLTKIPALATSAQLIGLLATALTGGLYTITVSSSEETIAEFTTATYRGTIRLDDLRTIIEQYARASGIIAPQITITLTPTDTNNISPVTKTFSCVTTPAHILSVPTYLRTSPAAIIPPGAEFTFATCSSASPKIKFHSKGSTSAETLTHTTAESGAARIHTITAPASQGIINIRTGTHTLTLFVTDIPHCHRFTYTNAYNAPQHTYATAQIRPKTIRKAAAAIIDGTRQEYDIQTKNEFEIEIITDSAVAAEDIAAIAWARDITIDGHPVIINELETEHPKESNAVITVKITAALARPTIFFTEPDPARIFQEQFTTQFS